MSPRAVPNARALDLPGVLLVTVGLGGIVYGLIGASDQSLGPLEVVSMVVGTMALVGFVIVERHSPEPLVPLHLFGSRNFSGANIMTFLLYAGFGGALFLLPIVLIQVHGYSATAATGALVPFAVIAFVMGRWAGGLVTRYGEKLPSVVGPRRGVYPLCRSGGRRILLDHLRDVRLGGDGPRERDRCGTIDSREERQRTGQV